MRRHKLAVAIAVGVAIVAGAAAVLMRRSTPPEATRLLPVADAYVFFDLAPLRAAGLFKNTPTQDPDYQQFVRDTGFEFERDLDQAAFAVHFANPPGQNGTGPAPETRYSEVFVGRFDDARLTAYLRKNAASAKPYGKTVIYAIALPGRTVRVAKLSDNMVAATNTDGPFVIQGMIDRQAETFGPRGSELLRAYYPKIPLASLIWAIARTSSPQEEGNARFVLPGSYDVFFPAGTVIVAAVRYVGSVQFRGEAYTRNAEEARRVAEQLNAFLALARAVEVRAQIGNGDPDLKSFFDSFSVSQYQDRAELNATVPPGLLKKIVSEPPTVPVVAPPAMVEKKPEKPRRKNKGK